nr:MAG: major capsid protein [Microvirus sp.]
MLSKNLGGDRLGSGNKMKIQMRNYERSTHDLSYLWRSTMATGTLVPYMKILGLPGDTFDIDLNAHVLTLPTVGPLFGSFKLQLDVFVCPLRLYNAQLHMNKLNVGLDMSKVKFPLAYIITSALNANLDSPVETRQISQSSLLAYLGHRGNGYLNNTTAPDRHINAIPILAYYDIYKNYYANKMENVGYIIQGGGSSQIQVYTALGQPITFPITSFPTPALLIRVPEKVEAREVVIKHESGTYTLPEVFNTVKKAIIDGNTEFIVTGYSAGIATGTTYGFSYADESKNLRMYQFPLENIDLMREKILQQPSTSALTLNGGSSTLEPYRSILRRINDGSLSDLNSKSYSWFAMNGLALKTYQSDIFNNWLRNDIVNGTGGTSINEISAVSTVGGKFTIDSLNLAKKVYDMLNRIAVSGGSYEDWISAVYTHQPYRRTESPVYMGGLSKEIVFQEVVANSGFENEYGEKEALGSLAGRGILSNKHKGGNIYIKLDEPSYIIGIISITPRLDYSQGNDWDMKLRTMNDLHKPALDGIGFQDLITDQMAYWEAHGNVSNPITYSAGKQPAWLNYMTNFNKCYGNFANPDDQMFMTLNRRYECDETTRRIKDLTTYIDPKKFNYIFADTERDAQNFWVQLAVDITARRKMSAKIIPNL